MGRSNILLVEDDFSSGNAIKLVLEFLDYDVDWHRCAETVYDDFRDGTPRADAVVLDLALGRVDGVSLVKRLRAEYAALPPILIFTALPQEVLDEAVRETRAFGGLRKPAGLHQLSSMLKLAVST